MPFTEALQSDAPAPLHEVWQKFYERLKDLSDAHQQKLAPYTAEIERAVLVSDFLAENLLRYPLEAATWIEESTGAEIGQEVSILWQELESVDEETFYKRLREHRRKRMFQIIWQDLVRNDPFTDTVRRVSQLACDCIDLAVRWCHQALVSQYGTPRSPRGEAQQLVVLGMGKLGAFELNVSSDVDLIFAYPEKGETDGSRSVDNQVFFTRLGQQVIQAIDKNTADGFVFRVDMRLRPYGQSGSLALSFKAMEEYYEDQGRDWERYAMIKAAPVAGDRDQGEKLLQELRPFVYRRYVDYGAIDSLRQMKELIAREVTRKGVSNNIKLGAGGIREVEFIAQVFQLIRGGRDSQLQQRSLLAVLQALHDLHTLPVEVVTELRECYIFLRDLEHALQGFADRQTQTLPDDPLAQVRVAFAMGFDGWEPLSERLADYRQQVSKHFAAVIASPEEEDKSKAVKSDWRVLWQKPDTSGRDLLHEKNVFQADHLCDQLREFRESSRVRQLQAQGKDRLDDFMPRLLAAFFRREETSETLDRLLNFVEAVLRRSAYLVLLTENPKALEELVRLFGESRWIAEQIIQMPLLLDELLHTESLYSPPDVATLSDELRQLMLRIPEEDLEQQMEVLRYFKRSHALRVAASELRETLPLMKVSDTLTFLAETILQQVLHQAWSDLVKKHGTPMQEDGTPCGMDFAIIAYGKLGGIELSYNSDLDLVFIHDAPPEGATNGEKSVDNQVFFIRLGQRIVHLLTAKTASGVIYEADMRLRPSGNSGLLVSSLSAFRNYQQSQAWTWEHQALVRARVVAGNEQLAASFDEVRREILGADRDPEKLRQDVLEMRGKMRQSLATKVVGDEPPPMFDLKHDPGGIVDIEFMVQYMALRWASQHPEIIVYSDNIRILEALADQELISWEMAEQLCDIYRFYRAKGHRLALHNLPAKIPYSDFQEEREWVVSCWQRVFELEPE